MIKEKGNVPMQYPDTCPKCGKPILPDHTLTSDGDDIFYHVDCTAPNFPAGIRGAWGNMDVSSAEFVNKIRHFNNGGTPERERVKIVLTRRLTDNNRYHAQIEGQPGRWAAGDSRYSVIGNLISTHRDAFGIEIKDCEE